jgi:hypothetical protein
LNEQSVIAGKHRAKKMERLLLEMQVDLRTLKGRLQTELTDLGKCFAWSRLLFVLYV